MMLSIAISISLGCLTGLLHLFFLRKSMDVLTSSIGAKTAGKDRLNKALYAGMIIRLLALAALIFVFVRVGSIDLLAFGMGLFVVYLGYPVASFFAGVH